MFDELSTPVNAAAFVVAAAIVWKAGARLAHLADHIAEKANIGRAMLGLLLLGGITSLPELAVAVTATLAGAVALTVNDVLGSAAINVVILALADAVYGRRALSSTPASPELMLQGVLGIVLLALVLGPSLSGDVLVGGMGAWSWLLLAGYALALWLLAHSQHLNSWQPQEQQPQQSKQPQQSEAGADERPLNRLVLGAAGAGAAILVGGFVLASAGEALAHQTGLGTSFFGAVLLGLSTSLPEVSTVLAAVRIRQYTMAMSDVLGTNLFNVTIIVFVDALHPGAPVLLEAGRFAAFGALLAIVLTAVFLLGMLVRRDRTVLRMGYDSLAAVALYAAGLVVLYRLR